MRVLPATWPADSYDQTLPDVFLRVIGSAWPPAADGLPAGYAKVGSWEVDRDLVGSLLPGQVRGGTGLATSTGKAEIPQPATGMLAPWRTGSERIPRGGACQLIASYDGPTGSSAFMLGQFVLDPITGKLSEPSLEIEVVEDFVQYRKPHNVSAGIDGTTPLSPTKLVRDSAVALGLAVDAPTDFPAQVVTSYFPGKTDTLTVWQTIVAANLGALWLSADGTTLVIRDADYMSGAATPVETIDVLDKLEDLQWTVNSDEAVDRIELTYVPANLGTDNFWVAPKDTPVPVAGLSFVIDPKRPTLLPSPSNFIGAASGTGGTGTGYLAPITQTLLSSGAIRLDIGNPSTSTIYLSSAPTGVASSTIDLAASDATSSLTWGVAATDSVNTLTVDLGRNIQRRTDAQAILDRIVNRLSVTTYVFNDVRIAPDLRRELGDTVVLSFPDGGLKVKAITTGLKLAGEPGSLVQTAAFTVVPWTVSDFNAAMNTAHPGWTIADFNAFWNIRLPGATIADFNENPLAT